MPLKKKVSAYNLQELLVVLVIIGILILIAMPNFMGVVNRAKSIEAQQNLKTIYGFQKSYYYMHSKYANDLKSIDYIPNLTTKEGGSANYTYQITEASSSSFKARAVAVEDRDGDGVKNIWEIDNFGTLKEVVKD